MLTHDSLFRRGRGDGVALVGVAGDSIVSGEVIDVLVVLDNLRGDVVLSVSVPEVVLVGVGVGVGVDVGVRLGLDVDVVVMGVVEEVLLGGSLWGRGRGTRDRHASAAAVGNEIRCGWDARDAAGVRSEESDAAAIVTDIGRGRRGGRGVTVIAVCAGERTPCPAF